MDQDLLLLSLLSVQTSLDFAVPAKCWGFVCLNNDFSWNNDFIFFWAPSVLAAGGLYMADSSQRLLCVSSSGKSTFFNCSSLA